MFACTRQCMRAHTHALLPTTATAPQPPRNRPAIARPQVINNDSWGEWWGKGVRLGFFLAGPEAKLQQAEGEAPRVEPQGERQLAWWVG